jgi:hypothetical protein
MKGKRELQILIGIKIERKQRMKILIKAITKSEVLKIIDLE